MDTKTDYLIIGGGYGGLVAAALLANQGRDVTLCESHIHLGGCAGRYHRGEFVFDVGATTLSGFKFEGPLQKLIQELNLSLDLVHCVPGMEIHLVNGQVLKRHTDFDQWMEELERHWPHLPHRALWTQLESINQKAWSLLADMPAFPPKIGNLTSFLRPKFLRDSLPLASSLVRPLKQIIPKEFLDDKEWVRFVNEQLLISTQTTLEDVPLLAGVMGLCYPSDTWYSMGGITAFANSPNQSNKIMGR